MRQGLLVRTEEQARAKEGNPGAVGSPVRSIRKGAMSTPRQQPGKESRRAARRSRQAVQTARDRMREEDLENGNRQLSLAGGGGEKELWPPIIDGPSA